MRSICPEPLAVAPLLLDAFRSSHEEFGMAAAAYAKTPRLPEIGAYNEECLELLEHLIFTLGDARGRISPDIEDACIFLLEHLAAQFHEQALKTTGASIQ